MRVIDNELKCKVVVTKNNERIHISKSVRGFDVIEMRKCLGCLIFTFIKPLGLTRSWKLQILHLVVAQSSWEIIPLSTQIQVSKKYHSR